MDREVAGCVLVVVIVVKWVLSLLETLRVSQPGPTVHIPAGRLAAVTAGSYCILQHITGHSLISPRGCITISCVELLRACAA